jgi:glycosyltransferase involved in cell wall biosynthesis
MNERVTRALRRDARAWFGIGVVAVIVLLAVLAPLVSHHDPLAIDLVNQLQGPSPAHWLGTDIQGRDVWARLVYGSRVSLTAGIVSQAIALLLGLSLGLVAGYKGGWVDELVMRLADVTLAFPTLLLLIAMAAALQPSLTVVFFTIGVVGWAGMARLVRGQVLVVRQLEFVQASRALGARDVRVVHLGTDLPPASAHDATTLVTVGNLIARKRHADVLRALWLLRDSHPALAWIVVGDGPERPALERLAGELGLSGRLHFTGRLPHAEAVATAQRGAVFVLPSVDGAFGVAYVEAMAAGVPAIGARGEPGPEEIAAAGGGIRLVAPGDPEALAEELRMLLDDHRWRRELGRDARATVEASFTWPRCGEATVAAYEEALR